MPCHCRSSFVFSFLRTKTETLLPCPAKRQSPPCRDAQAATRALAELRASMDPIHRCRHPAYHHRTPDSIAKRLSRRNGQSQRFAAQTLIMRIAPRSTTESPAPIWPRTAAESLMAPRLSILLKNAVSGRPASERGTMHSPPASGLGTTYTDVGLPIADNHSIGISTRPPRSTFRL